MGKNGTQSVFDSEDERTVNSIVYWDQILTEPLKEFWKKSFGDVEEPIVMENNAFIHKKVCISVKKELGMRCHQHLPNSSNLNPIENIWAHLKSLIAKDYGYITSVNAMKQVVVSMWMDFEDGTWDHLIESMPERIQAVIKAKGGSTSY